MEGLSISSRLAPLSLRRPTAAFPTSTFCGRSVFLRRPRNHYPSSSLHSLSCAAVFHSSDAIVEKEEAAKFAEASKKGNLVPLYRCIFCDHLTPVLAYRCLVKEDDREAPSFLFESVEQGSRGTNVGRYSAVGAQPAMEIVAKENLVSIMDHEEGRREEELVEDPMWIPRRIMERWKPQLIDELPDFFCGTFAISSF